MGQRSIVPVKEVLICALHELIPALHLRSAHTRAKQGVYSYAPFRSQPRGAHHPKTPKFVSPSLEVKRRKEMGGMKGEEKVTNVLGLASWCNVDIH